MYGFFCVGQQPRPRTRKCSPRPQLPRTHSTMFLGKICTNKDDLLAKIIWNFGSNFDEIFKNFRRKLANKIQFSCGVYRQWWMPAICNDAKKYSFSLIFGKFLLKKQSMKKRNRESPKNGLSHPRTCSPRSPKNRSPLSGLQLYFL